MKSTSFNQDLSFNDNKVTVKVILETAFSKEIRILMKKGQEMKEHKAPFPIVVHLLEGNIDFGVNGENRSLSAGDILTLESNIPHNLMAKEDSVIRLTLSLKDQVKRVEKVTTK